MARFTIQETTNALRAILEKHAHERVCVIGTTGCGKSTLLRLLPDCHGVDLDAVLWPSLSPEQTAFLSQTPWTQAMSDEIDRLIYANVTVQAGQPLFGSVILDCEAVVYLDIDDTLLASHCEKRGISFVDAKNVKRAIEGDWDHHHALGGKTMYRLVMPE